MLTKQKLWVHECVKHTFWVNTYQYASRKIVHIMITVITTAAHWLGIQETVNHSICSHAHYHSVRIHCNSDVIYYLKFIPLQKERTGWRTRSGTSLCCMNYQPWGTTKIFQHVFSGLMLCHSQNHTQKCNLSYSYIQKKVKKEHLQICSVIKMTWIHTFF